jgi:hypothetical protein
MATKYVNGKFSFHQPCGKWNEKCSRGCGYIHLSSSTAGTRKKCCANGRLSSASTNFDEELIMDHCLEILPEFMIRVISSGNNYSQKSSTYNNLVMMASTVVCNYCKVNGWSRPGPGPQCVFPKRSCPSLYQTCIKYIAKLRTFLFHI